MSSFRPALTTGRMSAKSSFMLVFIGDTGSQAVTIDNGLAATEQ